MKKKIAAAAMGAALLGGGGLTALMTAPGASAADTSTSTSASTSTARPQPGAWESAALKKLVTAGTITQAQADAVIKALDAARPEGGPGGRGGPGLTAAAKAIGIDESTLRTALQTSGTTIADVARAHNVDVTTVIDALVADESSHLAQAVTDGHLTQAEANARKANATQRATDLVNGTAPSGMDGPPPGAPAAGSNPSSS